MPYGMPGMGAPMMNGQPNYGYPGPGARGGMYGRGGMMMQQQGPAGGMRFGGMQQQHAGMVQGGGGGGRGGMMPGRGGMQMGGMAGMHGGGGGHQGQGMGQQMMGMNAKPQQVGGDLTNYFVQARACLCLGVAGDVWSVYFGDELRIWSCDTTRRRSRRARVERRPVSCLRENRDRRIRLSRPSTAVFVVDDCVLCTHCDRRGLPRAFFRVYLSVRLPLAVCVVEFVLLTPR